MSILSEIKGKFGYLYQQGTDAYDIVREIIIDYRVDRRSWDRSRIRWVLTIHMIPGAEVEFPISTSMRKEGVPPSVALLAQRLDILADSERDWFVFHNFALQATSLKGILYLLRKLGF